MEQTPKLLFDNENILASIHARLKGFSLQSANVNKVFAAEQKQKG